MTDLVVPVGDRSVAALQFETDRAPFVVKNPKGRVPDLEVPWREGTSLRTSRRSDLVRILAPVQSLPEVEVVSADASVMQYGSSPPSLSVNATIYFALRSPDSVTLPNHRSELRAWFLANNNDPGRRLNLSWYATGSDLIQATSDHLACFSSGAANLSGNLTLTEEEVRHLDYKTLRLRLRAGVAGSAGGSVGVGAVLSYRRPADTAEQALWRLEPQSAEYQ